MRNPGWNQEQAWEASCDVTFDGVDFGPNLQYGKLTFLPAENRKQQLKVAGMPGVYDYSKSPAGYPVPENMKGTLELFVLRPLEWQTPVWNQSLGMMISPEGHFLGILGRGKVRLDFINSNRMYLMADLKVTKYSRFDLGFFITLSIDAEPYWWEAERTAIEWMFSAPSVNLFDPESITITPTQPATCVYTTAPLDPSVSLFLLHAPPGWYANVTIPNLDPTKTYSFNCRNIYSRGEWHLYDAYGRRIRKPSEITGTASVTLSLISQSSEAMAVGFTDVTLYDVTGAGVASNEITTLDAPVRTLVYTTNQFADLIVDGQLFRLAPGEDMEIFGLEIPPRSTVPVLINGDTGCYGFISYQRGARSCTL